MFNLTKNYKEIARGQFGAVEGKERGNEVYFRFISYEQGNYTHRVIAVSYNNDTKLALSKIEEDSHIWGEFLYNVLHDEGVGRLVRKGFKVR